LAIDDSDLLQNLIATIVISLLLMAITFYKIKPVVVKNYKWCLVKYRSVNNRRQNNKNRQKVSSKPLRFWDFLLVTFLIFFIFKTSQYCLDYYIKDYQSATGVVKSITYKSESRGRSSWIVKIQGEEQTFDLSSKQKSLISIGEIHTIIYAKRTGMILEVR